MQVISDHIKSERKRCTPRLKKDTSIMKQALKGSLPMTFLHSLKISQENFAVLFL